MVVWIVLGIVGMSLLVLGLAIAATLRGIREFFDVVRTIQVRVRSAADLEPSLAIMRTRLEELRAAAERIGPVAEALPGNSES